MAKWWSRGKSEDAPAPESEVEDDDAGAWTGYTDDGEDDEEPAQGAGDDVETKLEAALAERAEFLRQKFAEKGIDISDDGEPVIRDPKRFRNWATPAVGSATQEARHPAETPAPTPAAPPPPVTNTEEKEVWELTRADLERMVDDRARQIAQPMVDQLQQQRSLMGKRWVDEAMQKAADALTQFYPEYTHILDHPDFETTYKQQLSNLNPEWLDSPQVLASTAVGMVAWLDKDQMPDRKQPMDDRAVKAAVSRSMVPNSRPALDQSSTATTRGGAADEYSVASRWLADKRVARISPEDLMALDAVDEFGMHTIDAYTKAQKKIAKTKGGSR